MCKCASLYREFNWNPNTNARHSQLPYISSQNIMCGTNWTPCTMILVYNQLHAQFFMYVCFYSLHVSGSHVPLIKRVIVSMRHLVYVILCRWPYRLHTRWSSTHTDINRVSHWYNNSRDDGHMAARNVYRIEINIHEKLYVKMVIYKDHTRMHGQQNITFPAQRLWTAAASRAIWTKRGVTISLAN